MDAERRVPPGSIDRAFDATPPTPPCKDSMIKRLAALLPEPVLQTLRRWWYRHHIKRGNFMTDEPEFSRLDEWIAPGDWVIDVGANVGIYTRRMSELVGSTGRVIAFEPVPSTFELLASNTSDLGNVTLIQAAVAAESCVVQMDMPAFESGLRNHYQARITADGDISAVGFVLRELNTPPPALVKIDAEGHDAHVIAGLASQPLVPVLIVEDNSDETVRLLHDLGYESERVAGSPNTIWRAEDDGQRSSGEHQ